MTRAEKHIRNLAIRDEYVKGLSAKELAKKYSLSEVTIYGVCKGLTNWNNNGYAEILRNNSTEVIELLKSGVTKKEVAENFNVTRGAVVEFCRKYDLCGRPNKNSEEDAARKIKEKSDGLLEYISGYTVKEKPVRVRCVVCGGEFERTFHSLTANGRVTCPHCVERKRNCKKEAEELERALRKEVREQQREQQRKEVERRKAERVHNCPVCGTETGRRKYCCPDCARKANNKQHDHRRRTKIRMMLIDNDITVEGLYRRDSGTCYLCGGQCNLGDYTVRDGAFIAGDWYPSIDHVIPLAKGGEHSWSNVRLAHRRCNIMKSDNIL